MDPRFGGIVHDTKKEIAIQNGMFGHICDPRDEISISAGVDQPQWEKKLYSERSQPWLVPKPMQYII